MGQIVGGLYEIGMQIGAGGGGVVYLGRHIRLDKTVVLKADKRSLTADVETLKREVELLKNLSHSYIPQVYDFFQEDGVVYTVMDYIEGQSLDKVLERGDKLNQADVIKWACQLLSALNYLHTQEPYGILHGDIKPANIMLRSNGDICLIDYNIALSLGEDGAVTVGFSLGYASPEHYGSEDLSFLGLGDLPPSETEPLTSSSKSKSRFKKKNSKFVSNATVPMARAHTSVPLEASATAILHADDATTPLPKGGDGSEGTVLLNQDGSEGTVLLTQDGSEGTVLLSQDNADSAQKKNSDSSFESASNAGTSNVGNANPAASGEKKGLFQKSKKSDSTTEEDLSTKPKKTQLMLDVRSDIYCLAATLYHLLSGRRPNHNARVVEPLTEKDCSIAVAAIIQKAMAPKAENRYQSAEEMLQAFLNLAEEDERTLRFKRREKITAGILSATFLLGGAMAFTGLKQSEQYQEALTLAEYAEDAYREGKISEAVKDALKALPANPEKVGLFDKPVTPQAQCALSQALGVYQLQDGYHALDAITAPAAPIHIAISPNGEKIAVLYAYEMIVYKTEDQSVLYRTKLVESAYAQAIFAENDLLIFAGKEGLCGYDLNSNTVLWTEGNGSLLSLSGDRAVVAAADIQTNSVNLYDTVTGKLVGTRSFGEQKLTNVSSEVMADTANRIFALNNDGSYLAVSFADGSVTLFDTKNPDNDLILYEASDYLLFQGGFTGESGRYFAFATSKGAQSQFGLVDVSSASFVTGFEAEQPIGLAFSDGRLCISLDNTLVELNPDTLEQKELAYTDTTSIRQFAVGPDYVVLTTMDNQLQFYDGAANLNTSEALQADMDFVLMDGPYAVLANKNQNDVWLRKLENHADTQLLHYEAGYDHDEARLSQDGKAVMLFSYTDCKSFDLNGQLLGEAIFPDTDSIFDQQFRVNDASSSGTAGLASSSTEQSAIAASISGSYLEIIWKDGMVRYYDAATCELLGEELKTAPNANDPNLVEEFLTDDYRIVSSFYQAPQVYDRKNGSLVTQLETDSYLTYITQVGPYIVAQYVESDGLTKYGLLMDKDCNVIAKLPNLCDVRPADQTLLFDYESGDIRQVGIYSLKELMRLGDEYNK